MTFDIALQYLREGKKVTREGWNGNKMLPVSMVATVENPKARMWIALQSPTETSKMTLPYLYMKTAQDDLVPFLLSQTDVLAEDWRLAE
jgi:hypothetical protein